MVGYLIQNPLYTYINKYVWFGLGGCYSTSTIIGCLMLEGSLNKFPDFFGMDTFIDSTHKKL